MSLVVLDASVALTWCFPEEHSTYAYRVLEFLENNSALVPAHWSLEIANAMLVDERRGRLTAARSSGFLSLLEGLSITFDSETSARAFTATVSWARASGLSPYDAAYLELALRTRLPLASLDSSLNRAARDAGIETFAPK